MYIRIGHGRHGQPSNYGPVHTNILLLDSSILNKISKFSSTYFIIQQQYMLTTYIDWQIFLHPKTEACLSRYMYINSTWSESLARRGCCAEARRGRALHGSAEQSSECSVAYIWSHACVSSSCARVRRRSIELSVAFSYCSHSLGKGCECGW